MKIIFIPIEPSTIYLSNLSSIHLIRMMTPDSEQNYCEAFKLCINGKATHLILSIQARSMTITHK